MSVLRDQYLTIGFGARAAHNIHFASVKDALAYLVPTAFDNCKAKEDKKNSNLRTLLKAKHFIKLLEFSEKVIVKPK